MSGFCGKAIAFAIAFPVITTSAAASSALLGSMACFIRQAG